MTDHRNRYPGAQPFSDDDFSRKVFFGRENAARALTDKILANHVVTVYARSGLGKTSLLKAGVASRLREEGYLPLFVRVNDANNGPFRALIDAIPVEAARQDIEFVPGHSESLWRFFKTAEFWRQDLLLTPVLILDQFEELFTLQSEQARAHFLNELSYLTRGVRPPPSEETPPDEELSEHPPSVHIVLSLREDYLGFLEEAAEHIPQILDARFRLAPLELQAAEEAIVGPAAVSDPGLATKPFALDRATVTEILDYLAEARTRTAGETRRYVEPFQLQLICQHMEQMADARQAASRADLTITMADLGGEAGLTQTLHDFYRDAIEKLPNRRDRRASRRLCEEFLISPEGRRLSQEENELRRQLGLSKETLGRLAASRLLRSENRSESTYYELSHDTLVEPVLASRRTKAQVMGVLGIGSGMLLLGLSLLVVVMLPIMLITNPPTTGTGDLDVGPTIIAMVATLIPLWIVVSSAILLRGSARSMLRNRLAREPAMIVTETRIQSGFVAGLPALVGSAVVAFFGLVFFAEVAGPIGGPVRRFVANVDSSFVNHRITNGIGLDTLVHLVAAAAMLTASWRLCRWGVYRLAGMRGRRTLSAPCRPNMRAVLYAGSRMFLGGTSLLCAVILTCFIALAVRCGIAGAASMPKWLPNAGFHTVVLDCIAGYDNAVFFYLLGDLVALTALLFVAILTLRRGIVATRQLFLVPPFDTTLAAIGDSRADAPPVDRVQGLTEKNTEPSHLGEKRDRVEHAEQPQPHAVSRAAAGDLKPGRATKRSPLVPILAIAVALAAIGAVVIATFLFNHLGSSSTRAVAAMSVGGRPGGVAVDPGSHTVYVTDIEHGAVSVIDGSTRAVTDTVPVGGRPGGVAVDPGTHTVYVTDIEHGAVSVIDGSTRVVTDTVPVGGSPFGVAVDPGTHTVYVTDIEHGAVSVIDGSTRVVTDTVAVGGSPFGVAVDPGTHTVYVADIEHGAVSVIDGSTRVVTDTVAVGGSPFGVAVDPGSRTVYVANREHGAVSVIDGSTRVVTDTVPVGGSPFGVAVDPGSRTVYVADIEHGAVSVIDGSTRVVTDTVPVGGSPFGVAVDPGSRTVYVANREHGTVILIEPR
jgi:YVTN family beta-propeller protein